MTVHRPTRRSSRSSSASCRKNFRRRRKKRARSLKVRRVSRPRLRPLLHRRRRNKRTQTSTYKRRGFGRAFFVDRRSVLLRCEQSEPRRMTGTESRGGGALGGAGWG